MTEDNLCSIYEDRPDICRVDVMYGAMGGGLSKQQFYKLQKEACVKLRKKENNGKRSNDVSSGWNLLETTRTVLT